MMVVKNYFCIKSVMKLMRRLLPVLLTLFARVDVLAQLGPAISQQPTNQSVLAGTSVSLGVVATGDQPLVYGWLFNGAPLDGASSNPLVLTNVLVSQSGLYSVVVSNGYGAVTSSNALLSVAPLVFTSQPSNRVTWLSGPATFSVGVSGQPPFSYQWQCNGANIQGAISNSLVLANVASTQFGTYDVIVSNAYGGLASSNATLFFSEVAVWGCAPYGEANLTPGLTNIVGISTAPENPSGFDCAALRGDGILVCWSNRFGPRWPTAQNLVAIAGADPVMGVVKDGTGLYWAWDSVGGNRLWGLSNLVAVAPEYYRSLALMTNGLVVGTGAADSLVALSNMVAIAEGGFHCLALRANGTVVAWGNNSYGQTSVPIGLSNVIAITAGDSHSLAVKGDGTVIGWGWNNYGQAVPPPGLSNVVAIAAGIVHSLALRSDGTIVAWGGNYWGQTNVPVGLSNVVAIAAGGDHSMALIGTGPPVVQVSLAAPSFQSNGVAIPLPTQSGRVYSLQYRNSLMESDWTALPLVAGNGHVEVLVDPTATNSQRFYRVLRW
jgi:hypothetical protein